MLSIICLVFLYSLLAGAVAAQPSGLSIPLNEAYELEKTYPQRIILEGTPILVTRRGGITTTVIVSDGKEDVLPTIAFEIPDHTWQPLPTDAFTTLPEEDLLLLELLVDGKPRYSILEAYTTDGADFWLPLTTVIKSLGFPIQTDSGAGVAYGWFMDKKQTFYLNVSDEFVEIGGQKTQSTFNDIKPLYEDVYVRSSILESWFPIQVRLNYAELQLLIEPTQPLPYQEKLERQAEWDKVKAQKQQPSYKDDSPIIVMPYQDFTKPVIRVSQANSIALQGGESSFNGTLNSQLQGNMFGFSTNATTAFTYSHDDKLAFSNANLTLSKYDQEGKMLGRMKASQLELGDVDIPAISLLATNRRGRGGRISNRPAGSRAQVDSFVVSGFGPVGWDVEVYQNNTLLAFQTVEDDGRYSFATLPLHTGLNTFKVFLYGPDGEVEERVERFMLGQDLIQPGTFYYDLGALESSSPLVPVSEVPESGDTSSFSARGEYGITRHLSAVGGFYRGPVSDRSTLAASTGIRASIGRVYSTLDLAYTDYNELMYGMNAYLPITPSMNVGLSYLKNAGFREEDNNLKSKTSLDFGHQFTLSGKPLNYAINFTEETYKGNARKHSFSAITGFQWHEANIGHSLALSEQGDDQSVDGSVDVSYKMDKFPLYAQLDYTLTPKIDLKTVSFSSRYPLQPNLTLAGGMNYQVESELASANGRLRWDVGPVDVTLSMNADTAQNMQMGLGFATTFAPDDGWRYRMSDQETTDRGSIGVYLFVDNNQNNVQDEGEEALANIKLLNRQRNTTVITNSSGYAIIDNLTPFTENAIEVDERTLPDIYLKPKNQRVRVVPHRGMSGIVRIPVFVYGEIAGTVYVKQNGTVEPLANVPLILKDSVGKMVDSIESEYDGFYLFPSLPIGEYTVEVDAAKMKKLGFVLPKAQSITLTSKENIADGWDFHLSATDTEQEAPQSGVVY
ncbi:MAG: hypothetical protein OXR68_07445 [Alphaproteobacteria bacterium]|nr:hypothetical protein [Alphaproteobacteria bacterium]MDD9920437.1 hypothetical protein [Alphaproteobacteria bacterium]